jgi:hypothetical protein
MQKEDHRLFIYRVDRDDRISFVNDEWVAFAMENGLSELLARGVVGKSLWDFIVDPSVQRLYQELFHRVRVKKSKPKIPYRCDSPDCRRVMHMEVFASPDGEIHLINRILQQEFRPSVSILESSADRSSDSVAVCSMCKKIRLRENTWYEIEESAAILGMSHSGPYPQLSHSICDGCLWEWRENFLSL